MADDRLQDVLRVLEGPADPDVAFADSLYDLLLTEVGFRGRPALGTLGGLRPMRLVSIVLALALLAALTIGLAIFGAGSPPTQTVAPSRSPSPSPSQEGALPLRPESDILRIGEPAPTWTGTLVGGAPFSTDELQGRPAAIFLWCSCVPGRQARDFLTEASSRADSMALVLVSVDAEGTTQGLVDWLGVETPVVADARADLVNQWGLSFYPALVLLRADGTVADLHPATFSAAKLSAILDALSGGDPIPEPDSPPARVTDDRGLIPLSSVLQVGKIAPELRGPQLGGGELSTRDLLGRPTVVLHWEPPDPTGRLGDDSPSADKLLAAIQARNEAFNLLLVAHGEPTPGAAGTYLEQQGSDAPVIFDWDGTLFQRWGLVLWPTLVLLDADGRVAGYYGPAALNDPGPLLDALEAGEPLPSPFPAGV